MYKNATKQAQSNNGSPVLTLKLSGKQRNETRNMKHFTCKSTENPLFEHISIFDAKNVSLLKDPKSHFYSFLMPVIIEKP